MIESWQQHWSNMHMMRREIAAGTWQMETTSVGGFNDILAEGIPDCDANLNSGI